MPIAVALFNAHTASPVIGVGIYAIKQFDRRELIP
jgi:hypothetical protein